MSGVFGPKPPSPIPVVNPGDTQNRINDAMVRQLATGGTNADQTSGNMIAPNAGAPRQSTLTGIQ